MPKDRHHYVPKFYLKLFSSEEKRINLCNIERSLLIRNASLRDQCYRHRFYGNTDEIENGLSEVESKIAPSIKKIVTEHQLPEIGSEDYHNILFFVALQMVRTSLAAKNADDGIDKLIKEVYKGDPRLKDVDLDAVRVGFKNTSLMLLTNAPTIYSCLTDLRLHLICASESQLFVTSDNPVFKYNQYREDVLHVGGIGALNRGLQVFIPLSPKHTLLLYDDFAYKVGNKKYNRTIKLLDEDVAMLNLMQFVGCEKCIYFSDWQFSGDIEIASSCNKKLRPNKNVLVEEFIEVGNSNSSIINMHEVVPKINLRLSFIKIRPDAEHISPRKRLTMYREIAAKISPDFAIRQKPKNTKTVMRKFKKHDSSG